MNEQDYPSNANVGITKAVLEHNQVPTNPWREAVIDALVVDHIYSAAHDADPRKAVNDLLAYESQMALDPLISEAAQALIDKGRDLQQQESDPNATWLTLAHAICTEQQMTQGHISERLERLRDWISPLKGIDR